MKEKIGSKSRSKPKVSLTPSLRKSVQKKIGVGKEPQLVWLASKIMKYASRRHLL